ncbi:MAG: hypothetical protein ISR58_15985 [Anaerolineales bacterium]|nr:hypothetical protein [Chloroflexota bacterium]MBL6982674.1 hypothetical protein [Anaerolineales bacterium]
MSFMKFVIRCVPILFLTALVTMLGHHLGERIPSDWWYLPAIIALVLFATLQIFKQVTPLNFVLLLMLALSAGALLNSFDLESGNWFPWVVLSMGLVIPLVWGYGLGIRLGWVGALFFPFTIVYLLGWVILYFIPELEAWTLAWALIGLFVFIGLVTHIVTEARYSNVEEKQVPLASDLFILHFNLFWIGAVIEGIIKTNFH